MKFKISFRFIVTILSIIVAILLGLTRIADPELVEVMRLKYFDVLQKKYPRNTDGQTYSVIVDIDENHSEKLVNGHGQERSWLNFLINQKRQECWFLDLMFYLQKKIEHLHN